MTDDVISVCPGDCNGRGACVAGSCVCEVKYSGGNCTDYNLGYNVGFGAIFYILSAVSFLQLILCIRSEFCKLKRPSVAKACRPTVQKMLYVCMIIACGSRGLYHSGYLPGTLAPNLITPNLFSVYYPMIISGFSILICFWAETFHVAGLRFDKPRFLNKSHKGFIMINSFIYVVLLVQVITIETTDLKTQNIFSGIFASLMFLVLVFFLIYGVELYYKLRGAFITAQSASVDCTQATLSRVGLVSQALFQLLTSLYLMGEVMGNVWKDSIPVASRNILEILFRVFEVGVALWFPCCLWNWESPHQLWVLNPKKLLRFHRSADSETKSLLSSGSPTTSYESIEPAKDEATIEYDCWVCYDTTRTDAGPMIFPCKCKGDVAAVHHECLRRWLLESTSSESRDPPRCKVCDEEYILTEGRTWLPNGLTVRYWSVTIVILSVMVASPTGAYMVCFMPLSTACKVLIVGMSVIMEYLCLRLLGFNIVSVYRRARITALTIIGRKPEERTASPEPSEQGPNLPVMST
ncbi:predicted protein [Nematostella vectensis]|uniref:RING-CH-type domain-containing protein n=1 Tax=Nematostella vectensis TaxID=45351 RepID=A7SIG3_NEMVE|nr:predicted protein [Nematostella vectensis]|eukprot:XP_001628588.1 predicted protein [Nematostella vectensis]